MPLPIVVIANDNRPSASQSSKIADMRSGQVRRVLATPLVRTDATVFDASENVLAAIAQPL